LFTYLGDKLEKWTDYLISEVKYDADHSRIEKVKTHEYLGDKMKKEPIIEKREDVVKNLHNDKKYFTVLRTEGKNKWKKGQKVDIFPLGDEEFIKTEKNDKKEDNLGELPEF